MENRDKLWFIPNHTKDLHENHSEIAFCFYGLVGLTFAAGTDTADQLYDQGKIKEALQIYLKPEHSKDSYIQNRIGYIYLNDYEDAKKGVEWFRKSANQGNIHAQYNLGLIYQKGMGVPHDYKLALQWLSKAAEQDDPKAMNAMGNMYEDGTGVEKNELKAVNWYVKAAQKGNRTAQCNAPALFTHSTVIKKDYHNARLLLEACLKDKLNDDCCLDRMAALYSNGWGVDKDRNKARELREKAAASGSEVAMYNLGANYDYGIGVEKDSKAAMDWYQKAAAKDHSKAMYRLYEVYEYGKLGQPVDKAKAKEWKARAEKAMKEQGLSRNALMDTFRLGMEEQE